MRLATNLITVKPTSLEEGPVRYQYPEAIITNRGDTRNHCARCIQILKVILYVELVIFVGWIGCIFLSNYYVDSKYNGVGMPSDNADWTNDSVDDDHSSDSSSSENDPPTRRFMFWSMQDDMMTTTEPSTTTIEPTVDNSDDVTEFEKSVLSNPTSTDSDEWDNGNYWKLQMDWDERLKQYVDEVNEDEGSVSIGKDNQEEEEEEEESSQVVIDPIVINNDDLIQFGESEIPTYDEAEISDTDMFALKWLGILLNATSINSDDFENSNYRDLWEETLRKNADGADKDEVITTDNYDEDDSSQVTTERIVDNSDDLVHIAKSADPTIDETEGSDVMPLSKWFEMMNKKIINSDNSDNNDDWKEQSKSADTADEERIIESDDFDREDLFESFEDRWRNMMISNEDHEHDELYLKKDEFESAPMIEDVPDEDSSDIIRSSELTSLLALFSNPRLIPNPYELTDSDESDTSSDGSNYGTMRFYSEEPQANEKDLMRFIRDVGNDSDSNSTSSSEETTTAAPRAKRSADSSSDESGETGDKSESSESSSREDAVTKIISQTSSRCPMIVDENGVTIDDPAKIVDHIKKNWFKTLLSTPVPECDGPNARRTVTLTDCGKFVISCSSDSSSDTPAVSGTPLIQI